MSRRVGKGALRAVPTILNRTSSRRLVGTRRARSRPAALPHPTRAVSSIGGRQIGGVGEPARPGLPVGFNRRRNAGIIQKRSGRDDDLSAAACRMRKRRATRTAKRRREASCLRKVEAHHVILSAKPAESRRQDIGVCRTRAAGCPAASRTMALFKFNEWEVDLKLHGFAKTPAAHRHVANLRVLFGFRILMTKGRARRAHHFLNRTSLC